MKLIRTLALSIALVAPVAAHEFTLGELFIDHPWAAPPPPGAPSVAGYLQLSNGGEDAARLIGATADFAERVEIHETRIEDDVVRMRMLEQGIAIPAGEQVSLKPGGMHLMFVGPEPLVEGDRRPVTLLFEGGVELEVEFVIEMPDADSAPMDGMKDMNHSNH